MFSDFAGEALDFPRLSAGARLAYSRAFARGQVEFDLSASYRSRYEQTLLLGRGFGLDPYWLAHAHLAYTPRDARWSVGLWMRNLLDSDYDLSRNYYLPGTPVVARGEPRSAGVRLSWRY